VYHFVVELTRPFTLAYLLTALALLNLWRKRRETRGRLLCLTGTFLFLTILCTPAVAYLALGSLEWRYEPLPHRPWDVQAIVVLPVYVRLPVGQQQRIELDEDTMSRCLYAAELYHQGEPCPVLVSGGLLDLDKPSGPTAAKAMRDFIVQLGVPDRDVILEEKSQSTYENAAQSCQLVEQRGLHKVALVVDAVDMYRAERCFRKAGMDVVPAPCHYRATYLDCSLFNFLPNPRAAQNLQRVAHEGLGVVWYWVKGRI